MHQSSEEEEEGEEERSEFSVSVRDLMDAPRDDLQAPRRVHLEGISGTPDERCKDGLQCLRKGLSCLERDQQMKQLQSQRSSSSIVEEQRTCKASEAIPLRYEPLRPPTEAAGPSTMVVQRSAAAARKEAGEDSWHRLSKALLLRKASMANYILATEFLANKQPGTALKHVRYAVHCFEAMACLKPSKREDNQLLLMLILKTTSEVRHLLAVNGGFEEQQRGFDDMSEEDTFILDSAQSILSVPALAWVYEWTTSRSDNLQIAVRCLDTLRDTARHQSQTSAIRELMQDVTKKMGAIWNELGKMSMTQAENLLKNGADFSDMEGPWTASMSRFEHGVQSFRKVKDSKNEALVTLNIIRLHRIAFHAYMNRKGEETEITRFMRHHFEKACECFQSALQLLDRGSHSQLRNNILWDYSSTYLSFALHLQHNPPPTVDRSKALAEVGEMYRKASKMCLRIEAKEGEPLWFSCKDRLASLEYNLAEMHVVSYCLKLTPVRANKVFVQGETSYRRAVELFLQARQFYKMLQVQCKWMAFCNRHFNDKEVPERCSAMMEMLVECRRPLQEVGSSGDPGGWERLQGDAENPLTLLEYLLKPVLSACQHLLKRAAQNKRGEVRRRGEVQHQLKEVYRRGLEVQNLVTDSGTSLHLKFQRMVDFTTYLHQHFEQGQWPQALVA